MQHIFSSGQRRNHHQPPGMRCKKSPMGGLFHLTPLTTQFTKEPTYLWSTQLARDHITHIRCQVGCKPTKSAHVMLFSVRISSSKAHSSAGVQLAFQRLQDGWILVKLSNKEEEMAPFQGKQPMNMSLTRKSKIMCVCAPKWKTLSINR